MNFLIVCKLVDDLLYMTTAYCYMLYYVCYMNLIII